MRKSDPTDYSPVPAPRPTVFVFSLDVGGGAEVPALPPVPEAEGAHGSAQGVCCSRVPVLRDTSLSFVCSCCPEPVLSSWELLGHSAAASALVRAQCLLEGRCGL